MTNKIFTKHVHTILLDSSPPSTISFSRCSKKGKTCSEKTQLKCFQTWMDWSGVDFLTCVKECVVTVVVEIEVACSVYVCVYCMSST